VNKASYHGERLGSLIVDMMTRQKVAEEAIEGVKTELDLQARDITVKKSEVNVLLSELDKTRQRITKIMEAQKGMSMDRDILAQRIQERNQQIARIDRTLQTEKQDVDSIHRRMVTVQDNYDKLTKTLNDLTAKMDLVDRFASSMAANRADIKSMRSAFDAMSRLQNDQKEIQNSLRDTSDQINRLVMDAQTSRDDLNEKLETTIAKMTEKTNHIEREVDNFRRESFKKLASLNDRADSNDEKIQTIEQADHRALVKQMASQLRVAKSENMRLKSRLGELVEKVDPLLLLLGENPKQRIREICQEEMARYGLLDSYSKSRG